MITLYEGRIALTDGCPRDPSAANRVVQVLAVGPTIALARGTVGVLVLETDHQWRTWLNEGDLRPLSESQERLQKEHGLPHEFAALCWRSVDDKANTYDEAKALIRKYTMEFYEA